MTSKSLAAALLALLFISSPAATQVFYTFGDGSAGANTTTGYPAPYGNYYWGSRHQFIITAAEMNTAGIPGGVYITKVAFNVTALNTAQPHQNMVIGVGHTANAAATSWSPAPVMQYGPSTYMPVVGWNDHDLCGGFQWDGVSNLLIETCHQNSSFTQNASTAWTNTGFTSSRWYRADNLTNCGNTLQTGTSTNRPDIRLTVDASVAPPQFQANQAPVASLMFNNIVGNVCVASEAFLTAPANGTFSLSSNLLGLPWDIGYNAATLLSASGGAFLLTDGQLVSLDVTSPISFLNGFLAGGGWPGFGLPGATTNTMNIGVAFGSPMILSTQAIFVNPASLSGVTLTQANTVHVQ